jgi:hypothetical protein
LNAAPPDARSPAQAAFEPIVGTPEELAISFVNSRSCGFVREWAPDRISERQFAIW